LSGESCPEGTTSIRRVTEQDLLRAELISRFGRKNLDDDTREVSNLTKSIFLSHVFFKPYAILKMK